ncbi:hypothetical protein FQN57_005655 [Myotisia sp. PD_48]|nr:hypothetical protein FQN57_005655 [Myotisia sp. PD_48]
MACATFLSMPVEILRLIFKELGDDWVSETSLAYTCRHLHNVFSEDIVNTHALRFDHTCALLDAVLKIPAVGHSAIKYISPEPGRTPASQTDNEPSTQILLDAIGPYCHSDEEEVEWIDNLIFSIDESKEASLWRTLLLLLNFPNLTHLTLELVPSIHGIEPFFSTILDRALKRISPFDKKPLFPKLEYLKIRHMPRGRDEIPPPSIEYLIPFLKFPSLKYVSVSRLNQPVLRSDIYNKILENMERKFSSVIHLVIISCATAGEIIPLLIAPTRLEKFCLFREWGTIVAYPNCLRRYLLEYKDSLRCLCLGNPSRVDIPPFGSLMDFKALVHCDMGFCDLFDTRGECDRDVETPLTHLLPPSLEYLSISIGFYRAPSTALPTAIAGLFQLIENKTACVPRLRRLRLVNAKQKNHNLQPLNLACKEAGIELIIDIDGRRAINASDGCFLCPEQRGTKLPGERIARW